MFYLQPEIWIHWLFVTNILFNEYLVGSYCPC